MKLHFILADTHHTRMRVIHENEWAPYRKRIITVELTPEQLEAIKPRIVGGDNGKDVYEELLEIIPEVEVPR